VKKNSFLIYKIIAIVLTIIFVFSLIHRAPSPPTEQNQKQTTCITIFVHGSFGSPLSILSLGSVIQDKIEKTAYKNITKQMRKDPFFYQTQLLMPKGLKQIDPTFNLKETNQKKYAAFPIIKLYEIIEKQILGKKHQSIFYALGWSGLLSQKRRRLESVRFYNMLIKELQELKRKNITPKIQIIAHSHGGNLVANLALIQAAIDGKEPEVTESKEKTTAYNQMYNLIKTLPSKKLAQSNRGQKVWDYKPEKYTIAIDQLVLYGTPIQPETDFCFLMPPFKKVYNFYSEADTIQSLDILSTKRLFSGKTINYTKLHKTSAPTSTHLAQAKITINCPKQSTTHKKPAKEKSWWSHILHNLKKTSDDPTHKDFWFLSWNKKKSDKPCLQPLPIVMFTPLFTKMLSDNEKFQESELRIQLNEKYITISLLNDNNDNIEKSTTIPMTFIKHLKKTIAPWKPTKFSQKEELKVINKYNKRY
jgi:uncharacterized alpha/beta hydrolase family protein